MAEAYNAQQLDTFGLQEVRTWRIFRLFVQHLRPVYPYVAYTPGLIGPQSGLVMFGQEPIELVEHLCFRTSPRYVTRGFGKGALLCRSGGVVFIDVHPSCNPWWDWNRDGVYLRALNYQLSLLLELVQRSRQLAQAPGSNGRLVVLGDFNTPPGENDLYRSFMAESGLVDPLSPDPTIFHGLTGFRLDGIYLDGWDGFTAKADRLFADHVGSMRQIIRQDLRARLGRSAAPERLLYSDHMAPVLRLVPAKMFEA